MLVLTRKLKEQIVIGDKQLIITVLEMKPGRVRLGIDAPIEVVIRRRETCHEHASEDEALTTE